MKMLSTKDYVLHSLSLSVSLQPSLLTWCPKVHRNIEPTLLYVYIYVYLCLLLYVYIYVYCCMFTFPLFRDDIKLEMSPSRDGANPFVALAFKLEVRKILSRRNLSIQIKIPIISLWNIIWVSYLSKHFIATAHVVVLRMYFGI